MNEPSSRFAWKLSDLEFHSTKVGVRPEMDGAIIVPQHPLEVG